MAVSVTLPQVREVVETGMPDQALSRVLATATAQVERYAPDAPEGLQNEAAIRIVGYLVEQPASALRSREIGQLKEAYAVTHVNSLYHSGAAGLLAPWRVHRAGAVS